MSHDDGGAVYGPRLYFGTVNPTEKDTMTPTPSRIEIEHGDLLIEWKIADPSVAQEIIALILGRITPAPAPRPRKKSRSKTPITSEVLERVSAAYEAAPMGKKNRAVRAVLGEEATANLASNYIYRAREAGILAPSEQGFAPHTV